jgi:hypothetical protein
MKDEKHRLSRDTMKYTAAIFSIFLLAALASAEPARSRPSRFANPLLDDVVQMTRAGLADETIVAYVQARRSRLDGDTSADDLIQLRRAGVSETVVRSIASLTGLPDAGGSVSREVRSESGEDAAYPDEPIDEGYGYGYGYPYPYGYPYWYAYSPWFSGEVVIGGFGFRGGRFGHRGFGHGHFGGGRGHGGGHGGGHRGGGRR